MAEDCKIEVAGLPILTGCPDENEIFLVSNAEAGQGEFGYGLRIWRDLLNCILPKTVVTPKYFQVITDGDEFSKVITPQSGFKVLDDSLSVSLDGSELCRLTTETTGEERIMYTVVYNGNGSAVITFHNDTFPLPQGRILIIKYSITPM